MVSNGTDRMRDQVDKRSKAESSERPLTMASRRSAFARIRSGLLESSPAAILLTGEGGAGKSWLWNRVFQSLPRTWRAVAVDATSALSTFDFLMLIGDGLGIRGASSVGAARIEITATLREESADGRSQLLIIEDAQAASQAIWEEIRVLANHLGNPGGFAGLLLVAQTELVRRLSERSLASVAGRITDHVHLPPLDLDECQALVLDTLSEGRGSGRTHSLEAIHRDSRGNSREILRLARRLAHRDRNVSPDSPPAGVNPVRSIHVNPKPRVGRSSNRVERIARSQDLNLTPASVVESGGQVERPVPPASEPAKPSLSLLPSRPPIRLEDGLIEVGWQDQNSVEPEIEKAEAVAMAESMELSGFEEPISSMRVNDELMAENSGPTVPSEEWIDDPYAALQAWSEWARNRDRIAETAPASVLEGARGQSGPQDSESPGVERDADSSVTTAIPSGTTIRAEGQHEFSPYGQLFGEARRGKPA